jgi:hypothetical protein
MIPPNGISDFRAVFIFQKLKARIRVGMKRFAFVICER